MKITALILSLILMTGCATNGQYDQEKTMLAIGAVLVIGAVAAHNADSGKPVEDPLDPICVGACGLEPL